MKRFLYGYTGLQDILIERRRMIFLNQYGFDESVYIHRDSPQVCRSGIVVSVDAWNNNGNVDVAIRTGTTLAVRSEQVHLRRADGLYHGSFVSFGDAYNSPFIHNCKDLVLSISSRHFPSDNPSAIALL